MLHGNVNAMLRQKINKDLMFKELMFKEILLPVHLVCVKLQITSLNCKLSTF